MNRLYCTSVPQVSFGHSATVQTCTLAKQLFSLSVLWNSIVIRYVKLSFYNALNPNQSITNKDFYLANPSTYRFIIWQAIVYFAPYILFPFSFHIFLNFFYSPFFLRVSFSLPLNFFQNLFYSFPFCIPSLCISYLSFPNLRSGCGDSRCCQLPYPQTHLIV